MAISFTQLNRRASIDMLGAIPFMLNTHDPRPAAKQIDEFRSIRHRPHVRQTEHASQGTPNQPSIRIA